MNVNDVLIRLAIYSYLVGLAIYVTLLFTPFALAVVWPLGILPLILPFAGCWGVIPYPIIEYLGLSHTTGIEGMVTLALYYVVLAVSILVQVFIIVKSIAAMRNDAKNDCIFKVLQIHYTFTGIYLFTFFVAHPVIRDVKMGLNVFSLEYIVLILMGVYGLTLNLAVSLAIKRWTK